MKTRWLSWHQLYAYHSFQMHLLGFCFTRFQGIWWVRIGGSVLTVKDLKRHPMFFSERNFPRNQIRAGRWLVKYQPHWP
jgi:hypothetical protein